MLILLVPGLGLAAEAWERDRPRSLRWLWIALGLACAFAQLANALAACVHGPRLAHAAAAFGCWLLPLIFGVAHRRAQGPASGPRPQRRAPASSVPSQFEPVERLRG